MSVSKATYEALIQQLNQSKVTLVAVSKTKPVQELQQLYDFGQRHFGENYVQELTEKYSQLPADIHWHFIGHLQTNKVKFIAPFVSLIHGVDSVKLLKEINKQAEKSNRTIQVLLQMHIGREETKFGFSKEELEQLLSDPHLPTFAHIQVSGLMGMASFTEDADQIRKEFSYLKSVFDAYTPHEGSNIKMTVLSMGMSNDYKIAIEEGSTMVRIGSLLFGSRL
ncbi:MAG TPA: YggS family pyridoxal phosphate-dependent enzyme [Chitinophagaceae bacterium]|nr:YggS family pyridoxal phosphate-dependent enzyme [Chitinophagaceae bacterium]